MRKIKHAWNVAITKRWGLSIGWFLGEDPIVFDAMIGSRVGNLVTFFRIQIWKFVAELSRCD